MDIDTVVDINTDSDRYCTGIDGCRYMDTLVDRDIHGYRVQIKMIQLYRHRP